MHRPRGTLSRIPEAVRNKINRQILDGCRLSTIRGWLFEQTAEQDIPDLNIKVGEPYSLAWTRNTGRKGSHEKACEIALYQWYAGPYQDWLVRETSRDPLMRVVERFEHIGSQASEKAQPNSVTGGNLCIRSLLFEALDQIRAGNKDPEVMARLANAWARLNQAGTESEKLKLQMQEATDAGLQALYEDVKDNPAALALFNQFRDIVKASTPENS